MLPRGLQGSQADLQEGIPCRSIRVGDGRDSGVWVTADRGHKGAAGLPQPGDADPQQWHAGPYTPEWCALVSHGPALRMARGVPAGAPVSVAYLSAFRTTAKNWSRACRSSHGV